MNRLTHTSTVTLPTRADISWRVGGVGDFDSDGNQDILFRYQGGGADQGKHLVALMDKTTWRADSYLESLTDLNWTVAAIADLDADGFQDLVMRNTATGANQVWHMRWLQHLSTTALTTVAAAYKLGAVTDYDQDGFNDLVWRHTGTGANVLWRMNRTTVIGAVTLQSNPDLTWDMVGPR